MSRVTGEGRRMRVMTYNLKGLKVDPAAAAEVVRAASPDVLAVQEPPRGPLGRWRLRRFATAVGLVRVVNGWGARTTALLVAPGRTVSQARALRLPWQVGTTRRGVSVASVDRVRVVVVHLSLSRTERARHVELIVEEGGLRRGGSADGGPRRPQRAARWARLDPPRPRAHRRGRGR